MTFRKWQDKGDSFRVDVTGALHWQVAVYIKP
jgi:hypothetical protein